MNKLAKLNKSPLETGRQIQLTDAQKMDLIVWASSPVYSVIVDMLESEILDARDEAMATDPAEKEQQSARMTEAHGMAKLYQRFVKKVESCSQEQFAKVQEKANRAILKDQSIVDEIILSQASGNLS